MGNYMKFEPVIKWSGSKRALSEEIVQYFPKKINTYYEPFCGSCSVLFQLLHSDINVNKYICSDINEEVIAFFNLVKNNPNSIYEEYRRRWLKLTSYNEIKNKQMYYNEIRDSYNKTKDIYDFIFLANKKINYNTMQSSGYNSAQPLQFNNLDQLLWGIVKTLQYYSLPVMAIAIATLGLFLVMSGDDIERKSRLKGWIMNILVGGLLVFGSATLAEIIKKFVGGAN